MSATMPDVQEQARRFNEVEAVRRCYEQKRQRRRLLRPRSPLSEETLDRLDWQEAERECGKKRWVGRMVP